MRAVVCGAARNGGVLKLEERPIPSPGSDDVLIEVAAAGVSVADIMQRRGTYPGPASATDIPGLEVAGVVRQAGSGVREWRVGDRVCAIVAGGGYAEYTVVPSEHCLPIPRHWSMPDAAAAVGPLCTAWFNVAMLGRIEAGETLLVHGGSGGVGAWAVQLFAGLGNRVFATAGGAERCRRVEQLGAARCFDHRSEDVVGGILAATSGEGVDLVLDILGAAAIEGNLSVLKEGGRLIGVATQQGAEARFDLWSLYRKRISLSGSVLRSQSRATKSRIVRELRDRVWPVVERQGLRSVIDSTWPLAQATEAQARLESGAAFGKLVLRMDRHEREGET